MIDSVVVGAMTSNSVLRRTETIAGDEETHVDERPSRPAARRLRTAPSRSQSQRSPAATVETGHDSRTTVARQSHDRHTSVARLSPPHDRRSAPPSRPSRLDTTVARQSHDCLISRTTVLAERGHDRRDWTLQSHDCHTTVSSVARQS